MTQNSKCSLEACEVSAYTGSTGMQILYRLRINLRIGLANLGRLWLVDRQAERKRAKEREREVRKDNKQRAATVSASARHSA